jgi:hypothetical protein
LEDEAFPVQEHEDLRWEEEICLGFITADISSAPQSGEEVEEIQGEDRRFAGAGQ